MVKQLLIHVCDPKTGSSSIQEALYTHSWKCAGKSLLVPMGKNNHMALAKTFTDRSQMGKKDKRFRRVANVVRKAPSDIDVAVISSEFFSQVDPNKLKTTIEQYFPEHAQSVRLLMYVRPHTEKLVSSYGQKIKSGKFDGTLTQYFQLKQRKGRLQYYPRLKKWREVFGDQFAVHPMQRKYLHQNCVVRDFLNFAFEDAPVELLAEPKSNESVAVKDYAQIRELFLYLKSKGIPNAKRTGIGAHFARIISGHPSKSADKMRMHKGLIPAAHKAYLEDAKMVDAEFFEGSPLTDTLLAVSDKAVEEEQSIRIEDHFNEDEVRLLRGWYELISLFISSDPDPWRKFINNKKRENMRLKGSLIAQQSSQIGS